MHAVNIPDWARARSVSFQELDPRSTALVVVDLQNAFVAPDGCMPIPSALQIIPRVNELVDAFRAKGATIVFLRHTISSDPRFAVKAWQSSRGNAPSVPAENLTPGHRDHELHGSLSVRPGDILVDKHRYSAMPVHSSDLHERLSRRGIDTLVICGAATNVCCETTARDAAMLDYRVFFVSDATATLNDELHNATLLTLSVIFADVRSAESVLALLQSAP